MIMIKLLIKSSIYTLLFAWWNTCFATSLHAHIQGWQPSNYKYCMFTLVFISVQLSFSVADTAKSGGGVGYTRGHKWG